ncbi:uncharacterized protein LOC106158210 [Lingula anatina]|uniref:Uncharacterized protein LOC106158210 n=1 Tax=Lingula anatina TaxID=7574 RepID=A0A1S3HVJ3_LINAN|nr:uncharacterized protein LOC106158210 [Lingula anatina]|eukprot:XP_013389566.1 uncharacterized protein LOC106158210 [Lingula anatina]
MDCTDIVIGRARGMRGNVGDYYTRDRSSPRPDSFYDNGFNSLTAALAYEQNGVTTVLFRKKLEATEQQDHDIRNELMHVIWARGQQIGQYHHNPESGLEKGNPAVSNFYRPDEIKYHGHGAQRGQARLNFVEQPITKPCGNEYKQPTSCTDDDCEYKATWEYDAAVDEVTFTLKAKNTENKWIGIGFSPDRNMPDTDVIVGWVEADGRVVVQDRKAVGYSPPLVDSRSDIKNIEGSQLFGVTTIKFTRARNTGDNQNDFQFSDTDCYYFMYAVGGSVSGTSINKHAKTPVISSEKICIKTCSSVTVTMSASVRFTSVTFSENLRNRNTEEFIELESKVKAAVEPALKEALPGYRSVRVAEFAPGSVVAKLDIEADVPDNSEAAAQSDSLEALKRANYSSQSLTADLGSITVEPKKQQGTDKKPTGDLTDIQIFSIIGGVGGAIILIGVFILVERCCHFRKERAYRKSTQSLTSHKDQPRDNSKVYYDNNGFDGNGYTHDAPVQDDNHIEEKQ